MPDPNSWNHNITIEFRANQIICRNSSVEVSGRCVNRLGLLSSLSGSA